MTNVDILVQQIEKLSFMVEYLADTGLYIEDAEEAWEIEKEERYAH